MEEKALRKILVMLLVFATFLVAACGEQTETKEKRTLVLYSQLSQDFTEALLTAHKPADDFLQIKAVYEMKAETPAPDLVLAERNALFEMQEAGSLQAVISSAGDRLPKKFKDADGYWYGAFYDPAVFLVNQQYARTVGQEKLRGWFDLVTYNQDIHIAVENISNSNSTINFIGSFASNNGENATLNYLSHIHNKIDQYAKFPFTPIRMAAVGDVDLAITRQSFVSQYLENNFPAYVIFPKEGTPINLYGIAVYKECKSVEAAKNFIDWLIADEEVKCISQTIDTGYMFLLPNGVTGAAADPENLWLNTNYLHKDQQDALTARWLENVRFNKNDQEENYEIRYGQPWLS